MAVLPGSTTRSGPLGASTARAPDDARALRVVVMALFFTFGGVTSLNDVIIPKLRGLFALSHAQAMLVQSAFFLAYLIVSLPAAALARKIGYLRGAVAGLLLMLAGCLLFTPASASAQYGLFLLALFVLASGVAMVQIVANPLISRLGPPDTASSRLTFAQAFNALGTTIFPFFGARIMLGGLASTAQLQGPARDAWRVAETRAVVHAYLGLAAALAVVAGIVWANRHRLQRDTARSGALFSGFDLLRCPRFAFGAACIFAYVGAEVTIGSTIVNYLEQAQVLALDQRSAGQLIPLYWGGSLLGRFVGSAVLRFVSPGKALCANGCGAIALILISANSSGALAAYSLLAIGLMNSIMFPTIFSLACAGLGPRAADGSGLICIAIVGGAVLPPLAGGLADITGSLSLSLALPALCYALIASFGLCASGAMPGRASPGA